MRDPWVGLLKDDWSLSFLYMKTESFVGANSAFPPRNHFLEMVKAQVLLVTPHLSRWTADMKQRVSFPFSWERKKQHSISSTLFRYWEVSLKSQNYRAHFSGWVVSEGYRIQGTKWSGWARVTGVEQHCDPVCAPQELPCSARKRDDDNWTPKINPMLLALQKPTVQCQHCALAISERSALSLSAHPWGTWRGGVFFCSCAHPCDWHS